MKKSDTHAFVNQLLVCFLVTICFGGSIGLGTVWMRHQIYTTANANLRNATQLADVRRHIAETNALIESELNLEVLRQRNVDFRLGLVPMSDPQVHLTRVAEDPARLLAARANEFLTDASTTVTLRIARN